MKIKTKEDALLHSFDLWLWLACHPKSDKVGWPGWKHNGGYIDSWCLCPICDYTSVRNISCMSCPVDWSHDNQPYMSCTDPRSIYKRWVASKSSENALRICQAIIDAM